MRTTKVKRLWPVLALAPLFALAAIFGVSLWHSGPGALTPPAAEAQDRALVLTATASPDWYDPPVMPDAGTCPVDLAAGTAADNTQSDVQCITSGDTIDVVLRTSHASIPATQVATFVTGVSGSNTGADRVIPRIQANSGAHGTESSVLGKVGVGVFLDTEIKHTQGSIAVGSLAPDYKQTISVRRSWADDAGDVWMFIYTGVQTSDLPPASASPGKIPDTSPLDEVDRVVQVKFTGDLNEENTGIINVPGLGTLSPQTAEGVDRSLEITRAEVELTVNPSSAATGTTMPGIGGQIEVVTTFTAGSALESGADDPLMDTVPATKMPPSYGNTVLASTIEGWETEGADADGPVRASVVITHVANDDTRTVFAPIVLYRLGTPHQFSIVKELDDYRVLSHQPAETGNYPVTVQLRDSLRQRLNTLPPGHMLVVEGSNDAATAILADEQPPLTFTDNDESPDASGEDDAFRFNIAVKNTATSGDYVVNLSIKESAADGAETVGTPLAIPITVIGAPDRMEAALAETTVDPGDTLMVSGAMFTDATSGSSAYTVPCHAMQTMPPTSDETLGSICEWTGKNLADRAVLEGIGSGPVNTNGTVAIMVKSDAAPGTYTLVIRDDRELATSATDKELQFTVRGRPTQYKLTGPTRIAAPDIASYTVTATDANDARPYLPVDVRKVGVTVLGGGEYVSTLLVAADGTVTLNDEGVATFTVVTAANTPPGTSVNIAISGVGADPVRLGVAIGPMLDPRVPSGLGATDTVDGRMATVTLTWTAGAGATRHWIAGIKQSDWTAGDFSSVIWEPATDDAMHTVSRALDAGQEYVFTVAAYDGTGWSDWAPLFRHTPRGGGLGNPFQ